MKIAHKLLHAKPRTIIIGTVVIIVGLIIFFAIKLGQLVSKNTYAQRKINKCKQVAAKNESRLQKNQILYVDSCFLPNPFTVKVGESVIFTNDSNKPMWIISDTAIGSKKVQLNNFNSGQAWKKGESYDYKFERTGRFGFHNKEQPNDVGLVTVE